MELDDSSWYVVRNTPGVTGFVTIEDEEENLDDFIAENKE